jgi:hypothetical protein
VDLALNTSATGYPTPLESDQGWGGGSYPWQIVDGLHSYDGWAHGLAFTGGHTGGWNSGGWIQPAGPRQATIDFGQDETFNEVIIWHHGDETNHVPATTQISYGDGSIWNPVSFQRVYGTMHEDGTNSGYSNSDIYTFPTVTGSKVQYSFDNSGATLAGDPIVHGWIYEFEVFNVPSPALASIPDQTINEGSTLSLPVQATDPDPGATLTYSLDSAPAGASIDPNTGLFTFTPGDGPLTTTATVRVMADGSPELSDAKTFTITVDNVPPTVLLTGPTDGFQGVSGQARTLTLGATDPSPIDQATGFTYALDWGDGTIQTLSGLSGVQVSHAYAAAGTYTATLTATDKDGGTSDPVTLPLTILPVEQQGSVLAVGGTAANDHFVLTPGGAGTVSVVANGQALGTFSSSQVMAYGYLGTDTVIVQGTRGSDAFTVGSSSVTANGLAVTGDQVEAWNVNGGAGNDSFALTGVGLHARLSGGADNDTFTLSTGVVFDGTIDGGPGVDTLAGGGSPNSWRITGQNAGTLNGSPFTGIENLTGGAGSDTFLVRPAGELSGLVDGGSGGNRLSYAGCGSPIQVDLQAQTAPGLNHFANIGAFVGSGTGDTLVAADTPNNWLITGTNAGSVGSFTFSAVANLVGGSGVDWFKFHNGKGVTGAIDGGGGGDWLDYAAYTTPVTVNLATGQATGVTGGVNNIQNVRGGSGGNTLTGNALGNILIGGTGADVLIGGSGRSILIGGKGSDSVTGGSDDDIMIGGYTAYDTSSAANNAALAAIVAEWQRTDETYAQRIGHIHGDTSGGLNGSFYLKSTNVHDDGVPDVLTGGPGMDWFWGQFSEITDLASGERVN